MWSVQGTSLVPRPERRKITRECGVFFWKFRRRFNRIGGSRLCRTVPDRSTCVARWSRRDRTEGNPSITEICPARGRRGSPDGKDGIFFLRTASQTVSAVASAWAMIRSLKVVSRVPLEIPEGNLQKSKTLRNRWGSEASKPYRNSDRRRGTVSHQIHRTAEAISG